jgi:autotransporter-associated beta strand protein
MAVADFFFPQWLRQAFPGAARAAGQTQRAFRPALELLENRTVPNTDVTISTAATLGGTFSLVGGIEVFTPDAGADTATVNNGDIQSFLNAGTSVQIDTVSTGANPGDITQATGASITKSAGGNATLTLNAVNNLTLSEDISATSGQLGVTVNDGGVGTISGVISGTGTSLTKQGAGKLTLTANNTYTGATTVNGGTLELRSAGVYTYSGGTIFINNGSTLLVSNNRYDFFSDTFVFDGTGGGTISATTTTNGGMQLLGSTTFRTNGGAHDTISGFLNTSPLGSATVTMNVAPGTDPSSDLNVTANVSNAGKIVKTGAGTLTLSGTNAYTGSTTINAGTLIVNGSNVTSPTNLSAGSLQGTGTVKSIGATGGTINPGRVGTVGTLTTAAGAFASTLNGATYQADIDGATADLLVIGTGATIDLTGATLSLNVVSSATGDTYTIVSSPSGGISGTFVGLPDNAPLTIDGRAFHITYTADAVTLTDVAVTVDSNSGAPNPLTAIDEGQATPDNTVVGTFTDPSNPNGSIGANQTTAQPQYKVVIDWGDGSTNTTLDTFNNPSAFSFVTGSGGTFQVLAPAHTYSEEDTFNITLTVTHDIDPAVGSVQTNSITVNDPSVVGTGGFTVAATEGVTSAVQTVATFTDPGGAELTGGQPTPGEYAATIDWGDGTATGPGTITFSGGTFMVTGSHLYAEEGSFTVSVLLQHGTAPNATVTSTVTAADQQITTPVVTPPTNVLEGAPTAANFNIATFTDPAGVGAETTADFIAVINWGDGTATRTGTIVSDGGGNYHVTAPAHTCAEEGKFTLTVTVTHDLLPPVIATASVTVADAPLTATLIPPGPVAGVPLNNVVLMHFTDANPGGTVSDFTATVTWGDGAVETSAANPTTVKVVANPGGGFDVIGSHTYTTASSGLTFAVAVLDKGGASASASATINVAGGGAVTGTAGPDTLILSAGPVAGSIMYTLNGGAPVTVSGVNTFAFTGGSGNDTMIVNLDPARALLQSFITFNGGPGHNTLVITGAGFPGSIFITQPPFTSPFGLGEITGGPIGASQITGRQIVTYSNVQTITIINAAAINAETGPDTPARVTAFDGLNAQERALQALYLAALGRAGSKGELDSWAVQLSPGATSLSPQVVAGIENSFEGRDHLVRSWYLAYLGRLAGGGEELGWVSALQAGQSEEQVLGYILGSPEFFSRAQTLIPSGTADERYIDALYELLLNRSAEPAGVAAWVPVVPGLGRTEVARRFLTGPEFRADQFEGYYNALLHRPDDPASLAAWVASGLDVYTVRIDFEISPEFFVNG